MCACAYVCVCVCECNVVNATLSQRYLESTFLRCDNVVITTLSQPKHNVVTTLLQRDFVCWALLRGFCSLWLQYQWVRSTKSTLSAGCQITQVRLDIKENPHKDRDTHTDATMQSLWGLNSTTCKFYNKWNSE